MIHKWMFIAAVRHTFSSSLRYFQTFYRLTFGSKNKEEDSLTSASH